MPRATITSDDLRRFAVARSLFPPTTLRRAIARMRFVQADPIRAPARAQDLILRHRVKDYRAGDLERNYVSLGIEEDTFVNYGFVTRELQTLMHPRPDVRVPAEGMQAWSAAERKKAELLLAFLQSRGEVHPREVEEHFAHGRVRNYWGGSSNATTQMLDALHYRGLVRVVRRENGIRIYRAHQHEPALLREAERRTRIDALVDVVVNIYAPLPGSSLSFYIRRLRYAVPQWRNEISAAQKRARERLAHARVAGVDWYWPERREPTTGRRSGDSAIASAVRSGRARPHPFRIVVELDLPFRSIHTGAETEARLLRVAAPVARSRHRLDESDGEKWCAARRSRLRA